MKQLLTLTIALAICLSGCSGAAIPPQTTEEALDSASSFLVGFGKGDITPTEPVPLQGTADRNRLGGGYATYLSALCLAITDETAETMLIMAVDTVGVNAYLEKMRQWVYTTYGIDETHFVMHALHQHSTPSPTENTDASRRYMQMAIAAMQQAKKDAMEDRAPATVSIATVQTEGLNFSRHYIANDPQGSLVTDNYNDHLASAYGLKCHETDPDNQMQLVKFQREGKVPIIAVNFQCHPHMGMCSDSAHGDWPAVMRSQVEESLGAHVIYFSGAGGNLSSHSRIEGEMEYPRDDFWTHGKKAADYVISAENSYQSVSTGKLQVLFQTKEYAVNHKGEEHLLQAATEIHQLRQTNLAAAMAMAAEHPEISSIYHAQYIITRSQLGDTLPLTIAALAFGDIAFTFQPYEMFDMNGTELKEGTVGNENYTPENQLENPFAMTLVCTMSNGQEGYIPSALGYQNGGYSTDITRFASGTGEELVVDYLQLLHQLYTP